MRKRQAIQIPNAAVGPYSPGMLIDDQLYISGQIPLDFTTGQLVNGDIRAQTRQVMRNIGQVLQSAGFEWRHLVKCTILLTNMEEFAAVNEVYASYLETPHPARATFAVADLPKGAAIEIEAVAIYD